MQTGRAIYYYNEEAREAGVSLLRHKLSIRFQTPDGPREVYWYYDQIIRTEAPGEFSYPGLPKQVLRIQGAETAAELNARIRRHVGTASRRRGSTLLKLLVFVLVAGLLFYFYGLP